MLRVASILLLLAGCASNNANGEPPQPPAPEPTTEAAPDPVTGAEGEQPAPAEMNPASLYAECRDRVENPQAEGECTTDADCVKGGCGSEVCTTTVAAADIMTTCEDRLCFKVLDTCGCNAGACSWSVKAEMPPLQKLPAAPKPLPTTLPQ